MFRLSKSELGNKVTISWYLENLRDKLILNSPLNESIYTLAEGQSIIPKIINACADSLHFSVVEKDEGYFLLDGLKRIKAIHDFVDGKLSYDTMFYNDMTQEQKDSFLNVRLNIKVWDDNEDLYVKSQ